VRKTFFPGFLKESGQSNGERLPLREEKGGRERDPLTVLCEPAEASRVGVVGQEVLHILLVKAVDTAGKCMAEGCEVWPCNLLTAAPATPLA
jgi:hypothetical protein